MRVRQRGHAIRVSWAPSRLRRTIRHRWVQAAVLVGAVVAVSTSLVSMADDLEQERLAWGTVEPVLVVTERLEPGELVGAHVELHEVPRAFIPPSAIDAVAPASRAKVTLLPGEIVLDERVTGLDNQSALPEGAVALTVPIVRLIPLLAEGDLVDLWSIDAANLSSRQVGASVVVLALADDEITIAVHPADVSDLAASSLRPLTVTLVG